MGHFADAAALRSSRRPTLGQGDRLNLISEQRAPGGAVRIIDASRWRYRDRFGTQLCPHLSGGCPSSLLWGFGGCIVPATPATRSCFRSGGAANASPCTAE